MNRKTTALLCGLLFCATGAVVRSLDRLPEPPTMRDIAESRWVGMIGTEIPAGGGR